MGANGRPRTAAAASVPPMKDRRGRIHSSNEDKADVLAVHFFPPTVRADLTDIDGYVYLPELSISQEITAGEVLSILKTIAAYKAPGRITYQIAFFASAKNPRRASSQAVPRLPGKILQPNTHPPLQNGGSQKAAKTNIQYSKSI
jgi:hypothetical protein